MKKITTLFKKDPNNLARVINEVDPEHEWVLSGLAIATRKWDGSAAAIIEGELYKRYDVKKGRSIPANALACQEPDAITGHHPHWVPCKRNNPDDKYFFEGFDNLNVQSDGTYELCGPKVQGNPEKLTEHKLLPHGKEALSPITYNYYNIDHFLSYEGIRTFLLQNDIEGIVFHNADGRMCKIRKADFGIKR